MPNHFEQTQDGRLLIASGFDPVLRWDGISPVAELAGVEAPTGQPALTGSGVGSIVGTYQCYVRFVDRLGLVSNLSPVSAEYDANGATGSITAATATAPITITSAAHGLKNGMKVKVDGVEGVTGANGTWTITVVDANKFKLNNSSGSGAYTGAGTWYRGISQITYSNLPIPTEQQVVRRQILRNTDGQATTFYVDIDTTNLTATTLSSTKDDEALANQTPVPLFEEDGDDNALTRHSRPPADRAFMASMLGRIFAAGEVIYKQGAVSVTYGSKSVTGIGTEWTSEVAGRTIHIDGDREARVIESVNVSTQTLTLETAYLGQANPYAGYSIRPSGDTRSLTIDYCESGLSESWQPLNGLTLEKNEKDNDITGLCRYASFMYVIQRRQTRRLTFQRDPNPINGDSAIFPAFFRGVVNNKCWAMVEGTAYLLDDYGVHMFSGPDSAPLSNYIQDIFDPKSAAEFKVNWSRQHFFHCIHDPAAEQIRWFVCLDGSRYPRHAVVIRYRTKSWWIEEYYRPMASSVLGKIDSRQQMFVGSNAGEVLALGQGEVDGPDPEAGDIRGTVTSAGLDWIVDSAASFATDGLVNNPIHIVDGTGRGQWRRVVSVSGTTIKVDQPWLTKPDTTSVYQLGGVAWRWRSKTFRIASSDTVAKRVITTVTRPTSTSTAMSLDIYWDRKSSAVKWPRKVSSGSGEGVRTDAGQSKAVFDLTKLNGFHQIAFDDQAPRGVERERYMDIELSGVKGESPVRLFEVTIAGVSDDQQ